MQPQRLLAAQGGLRWRGNHWCGDTVSPPASSRPLCHPPTQPAPSTIRSWNWPVTWRTTTYLPAPVTSRRPQRPAALTIWPHWVGHPRALSPLMGRQLICCAFQPSINAGSGIRREVFTSRARRTTWPTTALVCGICLTPIFSLISTRATHSGGPGNSATSVPRWPRRSTPHCYAGCRCRR